MKNKKSIYSSIDSKMSSNNAVKNVASSMTNYKSPKFILSVILLLLILLFIYTTVTSYKSYQATSPILVNGTIEGNAMRRIPANQILDPTYGQYGQEFTYSTWLYIKDTNFGTVNTVCDIASGSGPMFKVIFNKGSDDLYSIPTDTTINGQTTKTYKWHYPTLSNPGVFLYPNTNKLHIRFNTYNSDVMYKSADVGNIPLNKWFLLTIVLIGNSADIYINNMLKKRENVGVVRMNYGDLQINPFGGFDGYMSNFRYFNRAVQTWEIDNMYQLGANLKAPVENIKEVASLSPSYYFTTGFPNSSFNPKA